MGEVHVLCMIDTFEESLALDLSPPLLILVLNLSPPTQQMAAASCESSALYLHVINDSCLVPYEPYCMSISQEGCIGV